MGRVLFGLGLIYVFAISCEQSTPKVKKTADEGTPHWMVEEDTVKTYSHFDWHAANVYFLLTDRFANGDSLNDDIVSREKESAKMRGYHGGDFVGIQQKIEQGYFTDLGIDAIWLTPIFEQIKGGVDEGTGFSYSFHGYWARDWTAVEPTLGTYDEFKTLVRTAHDKGIRILLDVVINHTGPVTESDSQWPESWVRTEPTCSYQNQETAVTCTLTDNLPDIRTDSNEEVELPPFLIEKWKSEGRYEAEIEELNKFFSETGLARTPANYLIKWVTDYARETGVDGFRIDTVKHVEEDVWGVLNEQASLAFQDWKDANSDLVWHDDEFFVLGELYGWSSYGGRAYDFGNLQVDYFDHGYDAMINFSFKSDAKMPIDTLFQIYGEHLAQLSAPDISTEPVTFMNYVSSHDDGQPYDPLRENPLDAGTKLLLAPGMSQIYYGDEIARKLVVEGTKGDANLRSPMAWSTIESDSIAVATLDHWQKLGKYRSNNPAVGAGQPAKIFYDGVGYLFMRNYSAEHNGSTIDNTVVFGVDMPEGEKTISVPLAWSDGIKIRDAYSGQIVRSKQGKLTVDTPYSIVLLERVEEKKK